jgi:osmotically-inducible protein OsmY
MRKIISTNIIAAALITLPLLGGILQACSAAHQQESAGQYIDSSVITTKVKAKLLRDKHLSGTSITVKTYKNTVQLSGFVKNLSQKQRAVTIAQSVEGVGEVQDALLIKKH